MPQTDPFHSMVPRKMTDKELARAIRVDIESEMDATNLYSAHIEATDNEEAKRVLRHIMREEMEHAALFFELLKYLDPEQAQQALGASEKIRLLVAGASDEEAEEAGDRAKEAAGAEAIEPSPRRLTVGDLRRAR